MLRPYALLYIYSRRLRLHAVQELLAGVGIAIAVALAFATLVASGSIAGSAEAVVRKVSGPADLQLRARGPQGLPESLVQRVEALPGVKQVAPLLEESATLVAGDGRSAVVYVAGTDISLATLDGLAHTLPIAVLQAEGLGLSAASARALGLEASAVQAGRLGVTLDLRGHAFPLRVSAVLGGEAAGPLAGAQIAVMPLERLQELAGQPKHISRILIESRPGMHEAVRRELRRLAQGRITISGANQDIALLRQALQPGQQASVFFAIVAALLGLLFAFNAVLMTVPERRRAISDMRLDGARRSAIAEILLFQALALGVTASALGVAMGYALALVVFSQSPGYLAQAFSLGGSTVVGMAPLLIAFLGGVAATCLASVLPLLDLRRGRSLDAVYIEEGVPGNALGSHAQKRLFAAAILLLAPALLIYLLLPELAIPAAVLLALATVLALPLALAGVLRLIKSLTSGYRRAPIVAVAANSLRMTTVRSLALATTGAVALFGGVALGGARSDLLGGLHRFANAFASDAQLWVHNPGYTPETTSFSADGLAHRIASVPGVAQVQSYQSEFMSEGRRRVVILARPPGSGEQLLETQTIEGDRAQAMQRLESGGWVTVSAQIARERHLSIGAPVRIASPSGEASFRLAATTTNFGWPGGSILMSGAAYRRYWQTGELSALGIRVAPGASVAAVQKAVRAALGADSGLTVVTARQWASSFDALAGEGLGQLGWISLLLIVAAIVALTTALASSIWQRREMIAGFRLEGAPPTRLRAVLLAESLIMLTAGCLTGALAGILGEAVIDSYLRNITGFPVAAFALNWRPIEILAIVLALVLTIASVPAWMVSKVPPTVCLEGAAGA